MGAGASPGLTAAIRATSSAKLAEVLTEVPAQHRLKLQSAMHSVETVRLSVLTIAGDLVAELELPVTATVVALKHMLAEEDKNRGPVSRLRLLLGARELSDTASLKDLAPTDPVCKLALTLVRSYTRFTKSVLSKAYDVQYKMVLIGDSGVGKSAILRRFADDSFSGNYITTIGVDFINRSVLSDDGKCIKLQVWDTAGQERFRTITSAYYRGAHGIFIVFDVTDRASFEHVQTWLAALEPYRSKSAVPNAVVSLIGSKADLASTREVSNDEALAFATSNDLCYHEVSAKSGLSVDEAFYAQCGLLLDGK
mmetsp:Transcript_63810/g.186644  ORF Transcript_63810/g.186644 Transcript_63810/m.186644 type:complete len:310 (-) Transcript_63810:29-958(-)